MIPVDLDRNTDPNLDLNLSDTEYWIASVNMTR